MILNLNIELWAAYLLTTGRRILSLHPPLADVLIARHKLVSFLYDAAEQHKAFLVRGPPGSGKSQLARQLQQYIHERDEPARVTIIGSWVDDGVGVGDIVGRLEKKLHLSKIAGAEVKLAFKGPGKHWVLLDEAQSSYSDGAVHNTLLKNYTDHFIFVLFASHGVRKPRDRDKDVAGTPNVFTPDKRMGLCPTMNGSEGSAIPGLYFTKEEYQRLLEKQCDLTPTLAPDLQDYIFEVTNGHAGAMKSIMAAVATQCKSKGLTHMSLATFFGSYDTPEGALISSSSGSTFARALPDEDDIGDVDNADIVNFCKTLLVQNTPLVCPLAELPPIALEAHKRGWVIREDEEPDGRVVRVDFSSPLHRARLSYLFMGHHSLPAEYASLSLREFVIRVFCFFNGDNLHLAGTRVSETGEDPVPEARYHNEFYRACDEMTGGRGLWLSPEFGASRGQTGRVDFFVGSKRWGIEFLSEGEQIGGTRFELDGAYHPWIVTHAIEEWVVVDCRMHSRPTKTLLGEPNLLHVLFENSSSGVGLDYHILDNDLKPVGRPEGFPLNGGGANQISNE
ncbi:hypothetical protein DFH06DRAFT_1312829 [Mycena polygramma]|nr:hypothetical protein DFH06DRAFT_1312829 [Mycena polygramma]